MRIDKGYEAKISVLKDLFRSGEIIRSLEQVRELFGYANRSAARHFLKRLVKEGLLTEQSGGKYVASESLLGLPFFESVRAGLPFTPETSPDRKMDVNAYLIEHPVSTYLVRVKGDSMEGAGIVEGDIAVVDRSKDPQNGDIVIASVSGDVTIKRYRKDAKGVFLDPENAAYQPIAVGEGDGLLGVVVGMVRKYR